MRKRLCVLTTQRRLKHITNQTCCIREQLLENLTDNVQEMDPKAEQNEKKIAQ